MYIYYIIYIYIYPVAGINRAIRGQQNYHIDGKKLRHIKHQLSHLVL